MGEMKVVYSDKKVTPFGGMKLLKDFIPNYAIETPSFQKILTETIKKQ